MDLLEYVVDICRLLKEALMGEIGLADGLYIGLRVY